MAGRCATPTGHSRQEAPVASVVDDLVEEFAILRAAGDHVVHPDPRSAVAAPDALNTLTSMCMSSGRTRDCARGIADQTPTNDTGDESGHGAGW